MKNNLVYLVGAVTLMIFSCKTRVSSSDLQAPVPAELKNPKRLQDFNLISKFLNSKGGVYLPQNTKLSKRELQSCGSWIWLVAPAAEDVAYKNLKWKPNEVQQKEIDQLSQDEKDLTTKRLQSTYLYVNSSDASSDAPDPSSLDVNTRTPGNPQEYLLNVTHHRNGGEMFSSDNDELIGLHGIFAAAQIVGSRVIMDELLLREYKSGASTITAGELLIHDFQNDNELTCRKFTIRKIVELPKTNFLKAEMSINPAINYEKIADLRSHWAKDMVEEFSVKYKLKK